VSSEKPKGVSVREIAQAVRHPLSRAEPDQTLHLKQVENYVVCGLLTALFIQVWDPVATQVNMDLTHWWVVRAVGLGLAGFGAYLAYAGWTGGRAPAGVGWWVALILTVIETGGLAMKLLPMPLLIDAGVEALFFVSWVAIMFRQVEKQADAAGPHGANPVAG
jgi:hypothetical protein